MGKRLAAMVTVVLLVSMLAMLSSQYDRDQSQLPISVSTHSRCFHACKRLALHHYARGRKGIDHFPLILGGILIDFAIALSWNFRKQ
jgi:hypothetical protein